jgi:hypothetical protein
VNKAEARQVLAHEVARLRTLSYEELASRIPRQRRRDLFLEVGEDGAITKEVVGESGAVYQVETQVFWDYKPDRDIRVWVSIDDGGASAFAPMNDSFILAPDGSFVGE